MTIRSHFGSIHVGSKKGGARSWQPRSPKGMADQLIDEQIAEVRGKVNMLAEDSERLTQEDLGAMLCAPGLNPTEADLKDLISTRPQDDQGRTDFEEFLSLMIIDVPQGNYYSAAAKRWAHLNYVEALWACARCFFPSGGTSGEAARPDDVPQGDQSAAEKRRAYLDTVQAMWATARRIFPSGGASGEAAERPCTGATSEQHPRRAAARAAPY